MQFHPRIAIPLMLLVVAACSGIETNTNYDPASVGKLEGYRTDAWLASKEGADPRIHNPITEGHVKRTVDAELAARGYQKVDENPDFKIGWHGSIDQKMDVQTINSYYGYYWDPWYAPYYGPSYPSTYVHEYEEGTLVVDIWEPDDQQLVWRGTVSGILLSDKPEKTQKNVLKAIEAMAKQNAKLRERERGRDAG